MNVKIHNNVKILIDKEDWEKYKMMKWFLWGEGYIVCKPDYRKFQIIYLHRLIMNAPKGKDVDHINGNTLDCRKINIRICNRSQNSMNQRLKSNNTSGYKGVTWSKSANKWIAQITFNYKHLYLGIFETKEEAYTVYCEASKRYHGSYGRIL
jgi:hypothetical protein